MLDIWSLAKERLNSAKQRPADSESSYMAGGGDPSKQHEAHVIICGNKSSGKTTMVHRFLEVNEHPRPTVALEYKFGRSVRSNVKELGHIWELGGGALLANLLNVPLSAKNFEITYIMLVLDLSKPETLWNTMETILESTRCRLEQVEKELSRKQPDLYGDIQELAKRRIGNHKDVQNMRMFPIPLAFIGAKYEEFQNLDSDSRRTICRALRFAAHFNGASLHFYSNRMENLVSRGKAILAHFAFGKSFPKGVSTDFNKPLAVPVGSDSFEDIGLPVDSIKHTQVRAESAYELWKDNFCERFPQNKEAEVVEEDPADDPKFAEPEIDQFLEEKMRDLEMYIKQKKDREQLQAKADEEPAEQKKSQTNRDFDFTVD
ncbi:hypothetical protein L596_027554 [Steinernema carpocapsae]|uniref:Cytoplasmic dynein 2 light intermediate chain 1 n=1 Tax=Steinernema carpocapsae TaxID=34508 RepID=A0A4U5LVU0_STECR|nr:hypothetical protein L596_027554 [Steinernema carpocapsae]